ncbi:uncharacterized protein LOC116433996 isoform X2 [Nomia melanderi]|uniref:uncharacterized protein LOC116433996 isoform X2 n=1 Tax=Nomia melanderi TaxID=2448451 RepID=UPI0013043606|nr:abscission/NoCut checkpoint regulator isoform X2 [Nomia melanderi]
MIFYVAVVGVKKVCGPCYNKRNSTRKEGTINDIAMSQEPQEPLAPVDITKRLEALENPAKPPIVMYKHTNHWDKFKTGLEPIDQEIVDRLRKLKEEDKTTTLSVDEIRKKLALLKDEDPGAGNSKINIHRVDTRTDQQKTDDLIQEYLQQLELPSDNDPVREVESRLRKLQGLDDTRKKHSSEADDDEEEHVTKKLIAKALAEAELEKKYEADVDELEEMEVDVAKHTDENDRDEVEEREEKEEEEDEDEEEKPTCVMCNQTRNLEKCLGCYGDLYCPVCYTDNHDDSEMPTHKRVPATTDLNF